MDNGRRSGAAAWHGATRPRVRLQGGSREHGGAHRARPAAPRCAHRPRRPLLPVAAHRPRVLAPPPAHSPPPRTPSHRASAKKARRKPSPPPPPRANSGARRGKLVRVDSGRRRRPRVPSSAAAPPSPCPAWRCPPPRPPPRAPPPAPAAANSSEPAAVHRVARAALGGRHHPAGLVAEQSQAARPTRDPALISPGAPRQVAHPLPPINKRFSPDSRASNGTALIALPCLQHALRQCTRRPCPPGRFLALGAPPPPRHTRRHTPCTRGHAAVALAAGQRRYGRRRIGEGAQNSELGGRFAVTARACKKCCRRLAPPVSGPQEPCGDRVGEAGRGRVRLGAVIWAGVRNGWEAERGKGGFQPPCLPGPARPVRAPAPSTARPRIPRPADAWCKPRGRQAGRRPAGGHGRWWMLGASGQWVCARPAAGVARGGRKG